MLISPTYLRDVASGRRTGLAAAGLRAVLRAASWPYGWVVRVRNRRYDRGAADIVRPPVPVISVGNLTVGGTGKTPMVEWIARHLRQRQVRVAILSRGYGAEHGGQNDEALELELALPDVPHLQNPDRAGSAAIAVEELATQLLLLDDGFQHRRLARDADVLLLDASEPFGMGYVLPRGTLREPIAGLRRAQAVALSRADMIGEAEREAIRRRVAALCPDAVWCEVEHQPARLIDAAGASYPLAEAAGRPVAAFCGIGNPAGFRHTLAALGCEVVAWREFPDHHGYTRDDVTQLGDWARQAGAAAMLCTRKDLVKLRTANIGSVPLRAVDVTLNFLRGEDDFKSLLAPLIARAAAANADMLADEV